MIRLKQSMGNVIKCKIDAEDMISRYECSMLEDNRLNGLFNMQIEKNSVIVYSDEVKKNLADVLVGSVAEENVNSYLCQIARVIIDIKKMGLNPEKLILNLEWVYLTKDEKVLKFIYCPVNGMCGRYDGILFMKDVLLQAPLSKRARDEWKQWLENVTKTGITEQAVGTMEKLNKATRYMASNSTSILDEDGEALTGVSHDDVWQPMQQFGNYDEPMTGVEEDDDDGEALTGKEDYLGQKTPIFTKTVENRPSLVRVNTGEHVVISGDNFKLGRSEQRADFCIRNNSGISNVHATVIFKNGQYFLKDNYSTNGTYVDGKKIEDSSTLVLLQDGSVIQLYNEEIVFSF